MIAVRVSLGLSSPSQSTADQSINQTSQHGKRLIEKMTGWLGWLVDLSEKWEVKSHLFKLLKRPLDKNVLISLRSKRTFLQFPFSITDRVSGYWTSAWPLTHRETTIYTHINTFTISSDDQQLLTEILLALSHAFFGHRLAGRRSPCSAHSVTESNLRYS